MIRQATLDDLDLLVQGNLAMALETEGVALDPARLEPGVRAVLSGEQPGRYYVWEENGRVIAQLMITFEWSDWRNGMVWWIQSVYVPEESRGHGTFRKLYEAVRARALDAGAPGLRLYVDERNQRAQKVYAALGMKGDHYRVFEDMFDEPPLAENER
jgi:GNAT superfamily N-acetyltransferase